MKVEIINHSEGNTQFETRSGAYLYDGAGRQYQVSLNKFGELELLSSDGGIQIEPQMSNHIIIKTRQ